MSDHTIRFVASYVSLSQCSVITTEANMSVESYCRNERKMRQVIDQIKILANNLDHLRTEIEALKISCLKNHGNALRQTDSVKNNVLRKFKRYMKKVTSVHSLRNGRMSRRQEAYCPCKNSDPPIHSFLNYILRMGKRGNVWRVSTKTRHLRSEGNQTDEDLDEHMESRGSGIVKREFAWQNETVFARRCIIEALRYSDISCELESRVEFPFSSTANVSTTWATTQTEPTTELVPQPAKMLRSNSDDKRFRVASTQTAMRKSRRNRKYMKLQSKQTNLAFSRMGSAMITKIVRDLNESNALAVCRNGYPCGKGLLCAQTSREKRKLCDQVDEAIGEKASLDKIIQKLRNISTTNDETPLPPVDSVEEDGPPSSSSSSPVLSVDLDVNVVDDTNEVDEFTERRKPRTYVVHKMPPEHDPPKWQNPCERSVLYVGSTSDVTLFSSSFVN